MYATALRLYSTALDNPITAVVNPYIELPLHEFVLSSPYFIKAAQGLEAPELSQWDGSRSNSSNFGALQPRTIDLMVGLTPNNSVGKTISQLRDDIYRLINGHGAAAIELVVVDEVTEVAKISGIITKVETNVFAKESEVLISILCQNPMFKSVTEQDVMDILTVDPGDSTHLIIEDTTSTAPHGFELVIEWAGADDDFNIWWEHRAIGASLATSSLFYVDYTLTDGPPANRLYINSQYGELSVSMYVVSPPSSVELGSNLLAGSVWPGIYPGVNSFYFPPAADYDIISFTHYYTYWGL